MSNERIINQFIKKLQWDLRSSYNSSSCLGEKQVEFLKENLMDLLIEKDKMADKKYQKIGKKVLKQLDKLIKRNKNKGQHQCTYGGVL